MMKLRLIIPVALTLILLIFFTFDQSYLQVEVVTVRTNEGKKQKSNHDTTGIVYMETSNEHCYKRGNNWDECASDHLMYPKATAKKLYKRPYMCLFEPLCWLQLDWRNTLPPEKSCFLQHDLTFYDWGLHDGTMASLSTQIEVSLASKSQKELKVFSCNNKRAAAAKRNYHYNFRLCREDDGATPIPFINSWDTRASDDLARKYFEWFAQDRSAKEVDAHITSFIPPLHDFLMSFNRTIIVNALHRINMHRCTYNETKQTFENLKRLASSGRGKQFPNGPSHIIAPGYVHDVEYIRHYTGMRSIYLPFSVLVAMKYAIGNAVYSGENGMYIWNSGIGFPEALGNYSSVIITPSNYELSDLLKYRAAIVLPYSITNTKSLEQYELNIPLFAPSKEFALELHLFGDRTATYQPYCPQMTDAQHPGPDSSSPYEYSPNAREVQGDDGNAESFWISFSEIYLWPCVEYFSSWEMLIEKLETFTNEKYQEISNCMERANKWRQFESETNLCFVLQEIEKNHGRNLSAITYEESLSELYNITELFQGS